VKKIILAAAVALAAALMSGCVQMHMNSTIEKDGSGTMDLTVSLSQVVSESLEELKTMEMGEDMDGLDFMLNTNKDELQEQVKDHGIKITTYDRGVVDGRETVHLVMEFNDMESMSYAMREVGQDDNGGLGIIDNGDGTYTLRPYDYGWPPLPEEEEVIETETPQMDPAQMGKQMELMGKMMSALAEFQVSMKITVPGDIVSSNAPVVEGRTSIWTLDQSNMMTAGNSMEPDIVFSAKGLKLKAIKE
jgi:hypothetical protein